MASSLNGTGVTFNDATAQSSAWIGGRGQVFTATGTFTVPAGVTAVKVRLCGGGGGGSGTQSGTSGGTGGTTSFGAYCSATGGAGGTLGGNPGLGGTGTGGDINITGGSGAVLGESQTSQASGGAVGGASGCTVTVGGTRYVLTAPLGYLGGRPGSSENLGTNPQIATGYGNGGSGCQGESCGIPPGNGGGGGGYAEKYITGLTPGGTVTVTIGAVGTAGRNFSSTKFAGAASAGVCIVEW